MRPRFPLDTTLRFVLDYDVKATLYATAPSGEELPDLAFLMLDEAARECAQTLVVGLFVHALWGQYAPMTLEASALVGEVETVDGATLLAALRAKAEQTRFIPMPELNMPLWSVTLVGGFVDGPEPNGHEAMNLIDEQKAR